MSEHIKNIIEWGMLIARIYKLKVVIFKADISFIMLCVRPIWFIV